MGCRNMGLELGEGQTELVSPVGSRKGYRQEKWYTPVGGSTFSLHLTTRAPAGPAQNPPPCQAGPSCCVQSTGLEAPPSGHTSQRGLCALPLCVWCFAHNFVCSQHDQKFSVDISEGSSDLPKVTAGPQPELVTPPTVFHSPLCHQDGDTILLPIFKLLPQPI